MATIRAISVKVFSQKKSFFKSAEISKEFLKFVHFGEADFY
jgi:hypothetical protein